MHFLLVSSEDMSVYIIHRRYFMCTTSIRLRVGSTNSFSAIVLLKPPPPARFFPSELQACSFVVSSQQKNTWQVTFRITSPQILNQQKESPTQPRPNPTKKSISLRLSVSTLTRSQVSIRGGKFWCQLFDLDWLGGKLDAPWMS